MGTRKKIGIGLTAALVTLLFIVGIRWSLYSAPDLPPWTPTAELPSTEEVEVLAQAIRAPTVTDFGDPNRFVQLRRVFERAFPLVHKKLERTLVGDSLLYHWPAPNSDALPGLMLAHLDVVPIAPGTENRWTHPPFSGVVSAGAVWGRGTLDDKAAVVSILFAAERLLEKGWEPSRPLYFAFGHDEETGGKEGAARIAALFKGKKFAWILDEGGIVSLGRVADPKRPVAFIGIAEKGYLTLEFTVAGTGGHSSMPPKQTVIGRLARLATDIESNPLPARITVPAQSLLDSIGPFLPSLKRLALANQWLLSPLLKRGLEADRATNASIRTTTALTMVGGGNAENVLPGSARLVANFRLIPGDTETTVRDHLAPFLDQSIAVKTLKYNAPSRVSDPNSETFLKLQRVLGEVYGGAVTAPYLTVGGTDAKHYEHLSDNVYRFLPAVLEKNDTNRIHGTNERIELSSFANMLEFYRLWLQEAA